MPYTPSLANVCTEYFCRLLRIEVLAGEIAAGHNSLKILDDMRSVGVAVYDQDGGRGNAVSDPTPRGIDEQAREVIKRERERLYNNMLEQSRLQGLILPVTLALARLGSEDRLLIERVYRDRWSASRVAGEIGIDEKTARAWLERLERDFPGILRAAKEGTIPPAPSKFSRLIPVKMACFQGLPGLN